jgi:hypothetical protein
VLRGWGKMSRQAESVRRQRRAEKIGASCSAARAGKAQLASKIMSPWAASFLGDVFNRGMPGQR